MKIHEYQAKEVFSRYGVPVPKGYPAFTVQEAEMAAQKLIDETGIPVVVVKAQIHAGGRGKGGGVKVAKGGAADAKKLAEQILGMQLVTVQTGPAGQKVRRLYIEQGLDIARELYLALVVDRDARRIAVMASTEGGMDIEEVAAHTPEKIHTFHVDPVVGLAAYQARDLGFSLGLDKSQVGRFVKLLTSVYEMFVKEDCSLIEVNPLVTTKGGDVVALDASQVIYIRPTTFDVAGRSDTQGIRPTAVVRVKVIDVDTKERVYPASDGMHEGREVNAAVRESDSSVLRTRAGRTQVEDALAKKVAVEVG